MDESGERDVARILMNEPPNEHPASAGTSDDRLDLSAEVPQDRAGVRLDQVAAELFSDHSRSELARWIRTGQLTVDGAATLPKRRLLGGERLRLQAPARRLPSWQTPQTVPFRLCHEDDDLLVIDKPAGVVVHPGAGQPDGTLVNGLLQYRPALAALPRAGIVHRLDKDTTGLMLVAGSLRGQQALTDAIQTRRVRRRYQAVVERVLSGAFEIDAPIGRDPRLRTRQAVRSDGRPALTRVRVLERFRAHTRVLAELATGRTHQIRVHLASRRAPLVGDRRYGARGLLPPAPGAALARLVPAFTRQALHAAELELRHPTSGERMKFAAPLPEDLALLLAALAEDAAGAPGDGRCD